MFPFINHHLAIISAIGDGQSHLADKTLPQMNIYNLIDRTTGKIRRYDIDQTYIGEDDQYQIKRYNI